MPVTAGQVITREDLDACNLVLVANTKDDAMISFTFTSDGTTEDNGITPAIPFTLTIGGNNDAPRVGEAIGKQEASVGREFMFTIPASAVEQVDTDDSLVYGTPTANGNALPTWLTYAAGTFSGTPDEQDEGTLMISISVTDAPDSGVTRGLVDGNGAPASLTFTLQVNRLPIYGIVRNSVTHDRENNMITFTVVSQNNVTPPGGENLVMEVVMTSPEGYVENNRKVNVEFTPTGPTSLRVTASVPMARLVGPGGTVTATVKDVSGDMNPRWEQAAPPAHQGTATIDANDNDVRNQTVRDGLSGFARAMGWDTTDAISRRSTAQQRGGKQLEMTALKERLDSELNTRLSELSRSANASSGGNGSSGSNEIMTLIDTMNDRSVDGAAYGAFAGGTGYSASSYSTGSYGTGADAAGALASAAQVAGQSIYPTDTSGNAGTVYTGVGTDFRSWLAGMGTDRVSGAVRSAVDGAYNAMEGKFMEKMPEGMNLWTELTHSSIDFGGAGNASFDGSLFNFRMGVEREFTETTTLGVAATRFDGDIDHENKPLKLTGTMEVSGWNINPYVLWSDGVARAWVTAGFGSGDMDYSDKQDGNRFNESDSADIDTSMLAVGTEYDLVETEKYEVLARFEAMSMKIESDAGENKRFDEQDVESHGVRGEAEVGWPMVGGGERFTGDMRPYVTLGYRWDGGDGNGGNSAELGGGIVMQMRDFTLDGNLRTQVGSGDGDFERTSFSFSFSYDSGGDKQGMMLALSQDRGGAELDPFSQYATHASNLESGSSSLVADRMNVQAGYGFALDNGLLTFHSATDFNGGVMGQAAYGFTLETFGARALAARRTAKGLAAPRASAGG